MGVLAFPIRDTVSPAMQSKFWVDPHTGILRFGGHIPIGTSLHPETLIKRAHMPRISRMNGDWKPGNHRGHRGARRRKISHPSPCSGSSGDDGITNRPLLPREAARRASASAGSSLLARGGATDDGQGEAEICATVAYLLHGYTAGNDDHDAPPVAETSRSSSPRKAGS